MHIRTARILAIVSAGLGPLVSQVQPPIVNPANGHTYYQSTNRIVIAAAQTLASSYSGHLVAINDAAEDAWLSTNFPSSGSFFWIGLQRPGAGQPFSQWDSGEPLTYTNWCPGEPNSPQTEFYAVRNWCTGAGWNDVSGNPTTDQFYALIEAGSVYSNTVSSFGALPLDLTPFGMPGCQGRVSTDVTVFVAGNTSTATFQFAIPNNQALLGFRFHHQALVLDALAGNAAGAVMSDAATATIGS
jgi:lectin-like protein